MVSKCFTYTLQTVGRKRAAINRNEKENRGASDAHISPNDYAENNQNTRDTDYNGISVILRYFGTYGRYVFRWELICRVRYEQTSLTDGTVADDHALDGLHFLADANTTLSGTLERN